MSSSFFLILSVIIVTIQVINYWFLSKGKLHIVHPLSICAFIGYIIIETALALNDPSQIAVMLFNITNCWALAMNVKGWIRLTRKKKVKTKYYGYENKRNHQLPSVYIV
jgi:hypothetical protein